MARTRAAANETSPTSTDIEPCEMICRSPAPFATIALDGSGGWEADGAASPGLDSLSKPPSVTVTVIVLSSPNPPAGADLDWRVLSSNAASERLAAEFECESSAPDQGPAANIQVKNTAAATIVTVAMASQDVLLRGSLRPKLGQNRPCGMAEVSE